MSMNKLPVMLIGGPDAGKSNYLFRFWLAVDKNSGALASDGLPNDLEYLRAGVLQLLRGEFAAKTPIEVHNESVIPVKFKRDEIVVRGTLVVPDCAGEQWLAIYKKREWTEDWEQFICEGCGCLLFVRADSDQIVPALDWISYIKLFGSTAVPVVTKVTGAAPSFPAPPGVSFRIKEPPTQVVLVDWLQCIKRVFASKVRGNYRPRVGIVVAAWDSLPPEQQEATPNQWLESNFPLLAHFLDSNSDDYAFETFGISIVGGDLKNNAAFRKAYRDGDPSKAGYVVIDVNGKGVQHPDITIPVAWAMGLEKNTFIQNLLSG
jgi:hypothetical protein